MKKILFSFLISIVSTASMAAGTRTITGTIYDSDGKEPAPFAEVYRDGTQFIAQADENGKFSLSFPDSYDELSVSLIGYEPYTLKLSNATDYRVVMTSDTEFIDATVITDCDGTKLRARNIATCTPTKLSDGDVDCECCTSATCVSGRYAASQDANGCTVCVDQNNKPCATMPENATSAHQEWKNNKFICKIDACTADYRVETTLLGDDKCVLRTGEECTPDITVANMQPKSKYEWDNNVKKLVCPVKCVNGYNFDTATKTCVAEINRGDDCTAEAKKIDHNASAGEMKRRDGKLVCHITACTSGYTPNKTQTACECDAPHFQNINNDGVCVNMENRDCKSSVPNASRAYYKWTGSKLICVVDECTGQYAPENKNNNNGTCVDQVGEKCTPDTPVANMAQPTYEWDNATQKLICPVRACIKGYLFRDGQCIKSSGKCDPTTAGEHYIENAKFGELSNGTCHVTECVTGYKPNEQRTQCTKIECNNTEMFNDEKNRCETLVGKSCMPLAGVTDARRTTDANARRATFKLGTDGTSLICEIKSCNGDYIPNNDGTKCIPGKGDCTPDQAANVKNATATTLSDGKCVATDCVDGFRAEKGVCVSYSCNEFERDNKQTKECENVIGKSCLPGTCDDGKPCTTDTNASRARFKKDGDKLICEIQDCSGTYIPNDAGTQCIPGEGDCSAEQAAEHPNAKSTTLSKGKCIATDCNLGYRVQGGVCEKFTCKDTEVLNPDTNECDSLIREDCLNEAQKMDSRATAAHYKKRDGKPVCTITDCADNYKPNKAGDKCIVSEGKCDDSHLSQIPHATAGTLSNGKCNVTDCEPGYEVKNNKCVEYVGEKCSRTDLPAHAKSGVRKKDDTGREYCAVTQCDDDYGISADGRECIFKLTQEQSADRIKELDENYQAMREKEQSLENRILGATGIATMGAGGQMIAAGLAEQQSDADAERDMAAYLASFRCDWGNGQSARGGDTNISLAGNAQFTNLYREYMELAADLKARKTALEMSPGIESEVILNSANTGLYDNAGLGKVDGAFVSLADALSDPTGAAAIAWQEQKDATANKIKTGAIVAGVGGAATLAGDIIINNGKKSPDERSDEIDSKYQDIMNRWKDLSDKIEKLPSNGEDDNDSPNDKNLWDEWFKKDIQDKLAELAGKLKDGLGTRPDNTDDVTVPVKLSTDRLFKLDSATLTDQARATLLAWVQNNADVMKSATQYCITIDGYTDQSGSETHNQDLSTRRAQAVADIFYTQFSRSNIRIAGHGESQCTKQYDKTCRRVDIVFTNTKCAN